MKKQLYELSEELERRHGKPSVVGEEGHVWKLTNEQIELFISDHQTHVVERHRLLDEEGQLLALPKPSAAGALR